MRSKNRSRKYLLPVPARRLLQHGLSTGSQLPSGLIHLLWCGVFHRRQVDICSTTDLCELQGANLLHHGLHHRLQVNLCSDTCSISFPFFTDCVCADLFRSSLLPATVVQCFLHLLKYVIKKVMYQCTSVTDRLRLGQQWVPLGTDMGTASGVFLQKHACSSFPPTPDYQNLAA